MAGTCHIWSKNRRSSPPAAYSTCETPPPCCSSSITMGRRRKKPGGVSYVDPPSDEEIEIEAHATAASSSGGVRHQYSAFRTKTAPPNNPEIPALAMAQTLSNPLPPPESIDDMKKKYQVCYSHFRCITIHILYPRALQS